MEELVTKYITISQKLDYTGSNEALENELNYLETRLQLENYDFSDSVSYKNHEKDMFQSYNYYFNSDDECKYDFNY
ncbi:hypothetical protein QOZ83_15685 [Romboutsia sedimentorum]|uniref:hypothetical protein n=1 Tax=Romboutsia sedimentorum TaxID=1368474 RepID=UPI0024DE13AB|nr:hypothetical protein [Romboutsia sedimentorum]MDK2587288.1 hypothetical protein [Romboutsia sedimentorum]